MKLMGTRAGFHDLVFFYPVGTWSGLVIELKHGKGRMSPAQKAWVPVYQECGFYTQTCWGLQEAQQTMEDYINGKY